MPIQDVLATMTPFSIKCLWILWWKEPGLTDHGIVGNTRNKQSPTTLQQHIIYKFNNGW